MPGYLISKLDIINQAALATGNQPFAVIDDGSDEWIQFSSFYDRALMKVMAAHDWKFALNIAQMNRLGSSTYPGFEDIYQLPDDCLLLRAAYDARVAALIQPIDTWTISQNGINLPPMDYRLIGPNQLHCICPLGAWAFYVQNPAQGIEPSFNVVGFVEAVTTQVEFWAEKGINEDVEGAKLTKLLAQEALNEGREQDSGQEPRRIFFRSPMLERRKRRRGVGGWWGVY
jgi:hypothetical protein